MTESNEMKNFYLVEDNFLSEEETLHIEKELLGHNCAWYLQKNTVNSDYDHWDPSQFQSIPFLCHGLLQNGVPNSPNLNMAFWLLNKFASKYNLPSFDVFRAQINLVMKQQSNLPSSPHHDNVYRNDYIVAVYYVNDSDGNTILFKDNSAKDVLCEISPKRGRLAFFDGSILHAGGAPYQTNVRVVFNYNILKTEPLITKMLHLSKI